MDAASRSIVEAMKGPMQRPLPTFRLGAVVSIAAGPPKTVTLDDGRTMRYLDSYTPTVADVVVWVAEGSDPFVLGILA